MERTSRTDVRLFLPALPALCGSWRLARLALRRRIGCAKVGGPPLGCERRRLPPLSRRGLALRALLGVSTWTWLLRVACALLRALLARRRTTCGVRAELHGCPLQQSCCTAQAAGGGARGGPAQRLELQLRSARACMIPSCVRARAGRALAAKLHAWPFSLADVNDAQLVVRSERSEFSRACLFRAHCSAPVARSCAAWAGSL